LQFGGFGSRIVDAVMARVANGDSDFSPILEHTQENVALTGRGGA